MDKIPMAVKGECALDRALVKGLGLDSYQYIMDHVWEVDVSTDADFQRKFNYFYRVRKNKGWRDNYYEVFRKSKDKYKREQGSITFQDILCGIHAFSKTFEASFASKMLATLCPDKPIWDKNVLSFLGLKPGDAASENRCKSIVETYGKIEDWYTKYLKTEDARANIDLFNEKFPGYTWISKVKKIDFLIWTTGGGKPEKN